MTPDESTARPLLATSVTVKTSGRTITVTVDGCPVVPTVTVPAGVVYVSGPVGNPRVYTYTAPAAGNYDIVVTCGKEEITRTAVVTED